MRFLTEEKWNGVKAGVKGSGWCGARGAVCGVCGGGPRVEIRKRRLWLERAVTETKFFWKPRAKYRGKFRV